jgi:hypothetical protein
MQLELAVAKKERDFYLQKVEQSQQIKVRVRYHFSPRYIAVNVNQHIQFDDSRVWSM